MLTGKCDICGAEMRMTTPRYKVTFDGWLYAEEIDICIDCFNRIAGEIKQADTPQTDRGDFTDRLAYERGVKHAWEVAQKVFCSAVTFYEAEDVAKQITKDEPQTERIKTLDYCDICNHKGCDNCIANNLDDYCVPSGYEPITQTETQNSNLTFEKRTMLDCYNCKRFETEDECIECHYEPKDEPQTERCPQSHICCKPCKECGACEEECGMWKALKDIPQTDCARK